MRRNLKFLEFFASLITVWSFIPTISSCSNHTHNFVSLTIVDDKLYKVCECGKKVALTDSELTEFDGKFIIKDNDALTTLETTNLSDIQQMYPDKDTFDIYVTSGNFILTSNTNGYATFNFHGLLNSKNEYNLHINCGEVEWHIDKIFTFTNAYMHGGTSGSLDINGLHCIDLICNNCYFDGYQSIWASNYAQFTNCTFNPTNTGEYIFYTYGPTPRIDFSFCKFIATRKAIKVYREIDVPLTVKFENTIFNDPTGALPKAAIEVDSANCGALSELCQWNIYADDATIHSININKWDGVCKNRHNDYPISNEFVKFNGEVI